MNIKDSFPIKKVDEMPIAYTDRPGPKHTYDRTAINPADKEFRLVGDKIYMARLTPSGCMWSVLKLETWTPKVVEKTKETPKTKKKPVRRARTTKGADAPKKEE